MKILQIDTYHYLFGGAETVMFNTTKLLRDNGHEVIHFALKWKDNYECQQSEYFADSEEMHTGVVGKMQDAVAYFYNFEAAKKLDMLLTKEKPDLAQIHLIWGKLTASITKVLKKHGVPFIFTIHDYRLVCPGYTFRNGEGRVCEECQGKDFSKCIKYRCCKGSLPMSIMMTAEMKMRNRWFNPAEMASGILYVSNFAREIHYKYMPALKEVKDTVIYNPTDKLYAEVNKPEGEKYYLYFGRLSYEKGIGTLVDTMKDRKECHLKIVGDGPKREELEQKVREHGCKNIEFLGYKTGEELKTLVRNAYFIVLPSEWYENNPMTIIEGYSASTPVIGANIGGIPEIVVEGETGYQFESGNMASLNAAIDKAESMDKTAYMAMRSSALDFARKEFSMEEYYPKLMDFYQKVLKI